MTMHHGAGVTRTLSPIDRAFTHVVWQAGKPPLDSELNLMGSIDQERMRQMIASSMPSGFFMDPTRAQEDFQFHPNWINHFRFGKSEDGSLAVWANVNGWIIPVAGTDVAEGVENVVKLFPPPESDSRVDLVFLEVWTALVQPNPSTLNKPNASTLWRYGNVKHGGANLADDLEDPSVGIETTKRIQVQYRIRVFGSGAGQGSGVNLTAHPDGLTDPNVLGQGAAATPVAGLTWTNMRAEGDPSLWRAGTGDAPSRAALGTVDGYTYAIPICAIFRRCSSTYVAVKSSGNPNQNGAFLRSPSAKLMVNPLDGAVPLLTPSLTAALSPTAANVNVGVTNLNGSGLEDSALNLASTFLRIGTEIVGVSAVNLLAGQITIPAGGRGRWGTAAVGHPAGTKITFFNARPDGLFADEVAAEDMLDLRRAVNLGDWDFQRLLAHNVAALIRGDLKTAWKASNPGDTEGVQVHEVVELYAGNQQVPNHVDGVDGPDGIRTIWSDAATIQPDVTLLLAHDEPRDLRGLVGFTTGALDTNVEWDVGADFKPAAFMNTGGGADGWYNGTSIHLFIGGVNGESGARGTFRSGGVRDVRFVSPQEYWKSGYPIVDAAGGNQHPFTLRFMGEKQHQAPPMNHVAQQARYAGPLYPWRESRFERPFIVLGGLLHSNLHYEGVSPVRWSTIDGFHYLDLTAAGVNFDAEGGFYSLTSGGDIDTDAAAVATPILRGERTLYGMLTNEGRDRSGNSSEVYILVYGDPANRSNNGAFRVIGVGTVGYTNHDAPNSGSLVVEPLSADFSSFVTGAAASLTVEFRSQWHNADDISEYASRIADCVVVLTDIGGESSLDMPWSLFKTGSWALGQSGGARYAPSKAVLSTTLLYHPGRSATTRVPDTMVRFAMRGGSNDTLGTYLRRSPSALDSTFSAIGTATDETYWPMSHIQTWNRLPSLGWHAPEAPHYGGRVVGFTEQDREAEVFVDKGSKTVLFRPFRNRDMTLKALTWSELPSGQSLLGTYQFTNIAGSPSKDPLNILTGDDGATQGTTGKRMGFPVPLEFMPRFGRQDIPYYRLVPGANPSQTGFMPGINHLFTDVTDLTNPVFNIIGGESNAGGTEVNPLFLVTRSSDIAYARANSSYGPKGVGALGCRKTSDIDPSEGARSQAVLKSLRAVNSSDLGRGLEGIQLPPYVGIARLYGVYEYHDYINKGGTTYASNRYLMEAGSAVNLIREDADKQTLFILQDGAQDFTAALDDHTYIIPANVLDLTRIPAAAGVHDGYEADSQFRDFDYVVECTVFFFAKGWINRNSIVLTRKRSGTYALNTDGANPELENVPMCIPAPAGVNDRLYIAYNRTPYQGDPYMTRDGSTRQETDYENRYGRLHPNQAWLLRTAVQQFDSNGDFVPQVENERAFEVLAAMDFYTTMGTGKIGGAVFPGTPLDVGHVEDTHLSATRMPLQESARDFRVVTRAFSEGQKENSSRARAMLAILNNDALARANQNGDAFFVRFTLRDSSVVTLLAATADFRESLIDDHDVPSEDIFLVDAVHADRVMTYTAEGADFGTLMSNGADSVQVIDITLNQDIHPEVVDLPSTVSVLVNPTSRHMVENWSDVHFDARYKGNGVVEVRALMQNGNVPFSVQSGSPVRTFNLGAINGMPAGSNATQTYAWVGVSVGDSQAIVMNVSPNMPAGADVRAYISAADQITVMIINRLSIPLNIPATTFNIALIEETDFAAKQIDLSDVDLVLSLSWETGCKDHTASNLMNAVNQHSRLGRTVTASTDGSRLLLEAVPVGAEGNLVHVQVGLNDFADPVGDDVANLPVEQVLRLMVPSGNDLLIGHATTGTYFSGGSDIPVNAGSGTSQVTLTGMTERLPLGVLVQDSDFICENPLGDVASAMNSRFALPRPIQTLMPLTGGEEYTRFLGAPGELIAMADVQIAPYSWAAWTDTAPDGATKKYRIYRGGGAAYVLSGKNPGGPIDWVTESFPKAVSPVLKGGILAVRALLVRNFYEEALPGEGMVTTSDGDEIQMVLLTYAHLGNGRTTEEGIILDGVLSPSGYGEGYAAADRYRVQGRPMFKSVSRQVPDPAAVTLAVYPEDQR